mgnify:FL=1
MNNNIKKFTQVFSILLLAGFSFFYTEKVTQIVRNNDPIMLKIKDAKKTISVAKIDPVINDDEYITGVNGCDIDVDKSYTKMKNVGEYKEELLVLSETVIDKKIKNKYIISGNKNEKNVSIVLIIKDKLNNNLVNYLNSKKVNANFFIDGNYLSKNIVNIKELASNHNIYYLGTDGKYSDKYMIYNNNLININTKNESNYCITDKKDEKLLKLCTDYDMKTIKADYIENNILDTIKNNLTNGEIIVFNSEDEEEIKISINYILSKGYNIVSLNNLLNESNNCK